jgi:hypothetical protein
MSEQDNSKVTSLLDDHDPAISSLYRESAQDMPPSTLDDKILKAAHAALNAPHDAPAVQKSSRRWPLLGGLAASVLVGVLAVKLLPYSLQSPAPDMKERSSIGSLEADSLTQKPFEPPAAAISQSLPSSPSAMAEKRIQQDAATAYQADERETKAERGITSGMATDRAELSKSVATELPEEMDAETTSVRDEEFIRIVALWKAGNTAEATARFESFRKQYPDYTPSSADQPVFQALQSALGNL